MVALSIAGLLPLLLQVGGEHGGVLEVRHGEGLVSVDSAPEL